MKPRNAASSFAPLTPSRSATSAAAGTPRHRPSTLPIDVTSKSWHQVLGNETEERREIIRAIDAVKKRYQRGRWQSASPPELVADRRDEQARDRNDERAAVQEAAVKVLTDRQQRILTLICDGH